ncbi:MAG TPA: hypothetical protein VFU41_09125 [Gemmatimonadales bacterium]|nr:hypothetical protein [Gemmatimonadales bacterium]
MTKVAMLGAVCLGAALAGCGEGRVILNVDVLSFIKPSGRDTLRYDVPGPPIGSVTVDSSMTPIKIGLPSGLSKSSVVSDTLSVAALLENATGSGDVQYRIYFAKDSAQVYNTTPYIDASSGPVSGTTTVPLVSTAVTLGDTVFNTNELWMGMRARLTVNAGPNLSGRVRATEIRLAIILQDEVF